VAEEDQVFVHGGTFRSVEIQVKTFAPQSRKVRREKPQRGNQS